MRLRILGILLAVLMLLPVMAPAASAVTVDDLNRPGVFLKQSSPNGTCVLVSTAMMLRRAAILQEDENWSDISLNTVRKALPGMPHQGAYGDMTISHMWLPGGQKNAALLADLLKEHPEGIVLHARCVPHGVLLTDYTDGVFYCCDPAIDVPSGRIPITEAHGTRIENSSAIWYVSSSLPAPEPTYTPQITADGAVSRLMAEIGIEDRDSSLFGQPLAFHC